MTTLANSTMPQTTTSAPANSGNFSRFIATVAISPAILIAATFGGAVAVTQFIAPGTTGGEALVFAAVIIGLLGGFIAALLNPGYRLPSALYSASLAGLFYLSIRMFWLSTPMTLMSSGFLLIIPSALLGAYTAMKLTAKD